jgi:hypothetical protein
MAPADSPRLADAHQLVDMDRLRSYSSDISPALSGFEPHREPGLLELLGGGIHDGEIHAADPVRCRRGPARRRLGDRAGWPVDAIVIQAGAFGGVSATGAGCTVDLLPGHGRKRGLLHAVIVPIRHHQLGHPVGMAPASPKIRRAYLTVPEYGRAVVGVSARRPFAWAASRAPRATTIRRGRSGGGHAEGAARLADHLVSEAPFVVVPGHHLDQRGVHDPGQVQVDDGGAWVANNVSGD